MQNNNIIQLDDQLISGDLKEELEKSVSHRRKRAAITNFSNQPLSKWTFPIRYFLDSKYSKFVFFSSPSVSPLLCSGHNFLSILSIFRLINST